MPDVDDAQQPGEPAEGRALPPMSSTERIFVRLSFWQTVLSVVGVFIAVVALYAALTGERPAFANQQDATRCLAERLAGLDCLLVIDDVWNPAHLVPFAQGGERCTRLITTRQFEIAADYCRVLVDQMRGDEAIEQREIVDMGGREDRLHQRQQLASNIAEVALQRSSNSMTVFWVDANRRSTRRTDSPRS